MLEFARAFMSEGRSQRNVYYRILIRIEENGSKSNLQFNGYYNVEFAVELSPNSALYLKLADVSRERVSFS